MLILGWDTATAATAVALLDTATGQSAEARHDPRPSERPGHVRELLPLVEHVRAGVPWSAIDRVAVGIGPGSFTGLRIGLATARALAAARELPLVGVSTLAALTRAALAEPEFTAEAVLPVLDARRGEVFVALGRVGSLGRLRGDGGEEGEGATAPVALDSDRLEATVRALAAAPLAIGDGAIRYRGELERAGAHVPPDSSPLHRVSGAWVCRIAAETEAPGPPGAVLPQYVRAPDAQPR